MAILGHAPRNKVAALEPLLKREGLTGIEDPAARFEALAVRLASLHEPAYRAAIGILRPAKSKGGRPRTWTLQRRCQLVAAVLMQAEHRTVPQVCGQLAAHRRVSRCDASTLETEYKRSRRVPEVARILKAAADLHAGDKAAERAYAALMLLDLARR